MFSGHAALYFLYSRKLVYLKMSFFFPLSKYFPSCMRSSVEGDFSFIMLVCTSVPFFFT